MRCNGRWVPPSSFTASHMVLLKYTVCLFPSLIEAKHFIVSAVPNAPLKPPSSPPFNHRPHVVYCSPDLGLRVDMSWR